MIINLLTTLHLMAPGAMVTEPTPKAITQVAAKKEGVPLQCSAIRTQILKHYGATVELAHKVVQETHVRVYFKIKDKEYDGMYFVLIFWTKKGAHVSVPDQLVQHISAGHCTGKSGKRVLARIDLVIPAYIPKKVAP